MPQFALEGQIRDFIPIKDFRATHGLPPEFSVAYFEPKDYASLGRIDRAGAELNTVRQAVLAPIPAQMPLQGWMGFLPQLVSLFQRSLYKINAQVGLKDVEIDFAVAGFGDVCQALLYAMLRVGNMPPPDFRQVYADWLNSSIKVYGERYDYIHNGATWSVTVVAHAYGRVGLIVTTDEATHYVYDPALACPAEGYMAALLSEVAERMLGLSTPSRPPPSTGEEKNTP